MDNETLLKQIKDYYINYGDFYELPTYMIDEYRTDLLIELINQDMVEVLSEHEVLNPHIKGFDI